MEYVNYSWIQIQGNCRNVIVVFGCIIQSKVRTVYRKCHPPNDRTLRQPDQRRHCRGRPSTINKLFKSTIVSILISPFHRQIVKFERRPTDHFIGSGRVEPSSGGAPYSLVMTGALFDPVESFEGELIVKINSNEMFPVILLFMLIYRN